MNYDIIKTPMEMDYALLEEDNKKWVIPIKPIKHQLTGELIPQYMINVQELSRHIKENENYLFVREDARGAKLTYIYDDGYYKLVNESEFKGMIKGFIPYSLVKSKDINEIYFDLCTEHLHVSCEALNADERYINFKNGLFNIESWELEPHRPDVLSTIRIPIDYVPLSECETGTTFEYYLDYLTDNNKEVKDLLLEVCGLVMSNVFGYRTKKSLFLIGVHDAGKTQLKELITEIIGRENVATTDLERMNAQFGTSDIYQKRLGGSNDLGYQPVKEMVIFKQLTGGDSIQVEFKGNGGFPYKFKGFLWFNSNAYPKFSGDKDKALYKRIIPVTCNRVVPYEQRDSSLLDKMLLEKQYVVALCLEHLRDLIDRKFRFNEPQAVIEARDTYETENNNLFLFVSASCSIVDDLDTTTRIKVKNFKKYYAYWCESNGYSSRINDKDLKHYLEQKYNTKLIKSGGYMYFDNLRFTEDFLKEYSMNDYRD